MRILMSALSLFALGACSSSGDATGSSSTSSSTICSSGQGGSVTSSSSSSSTSSSSSGSGGGSGGSGGGGGGSGSGGSGGSGGGAVGSGTIVPLYSYPSDPAWATVASTKQSHPTVTVRAVINPASGPGAAKDEAYVSGIAVLDQAGVIVLCYVTTSYAGKPADAVHAEIDDYVSWYPGLKGVFFDEMSVTAGDETYYANLTSYVKGKGLAITVGNPGADTLPSFVGTVDTILIYESAGLPSVASLGGWHSQYDRSNFGVIPYAVPALDAAFVASARADVGFIYLTDDDLPNPWDTLPPYYGALLDSLK